VKVVVCDKKEIHLPGKTYSAGEVADVPDKAALRYLAQGAVERYETKVIREVPLPDAGVAEPLSALPAGQASTETTANPSEGGKRKRGRPRKVSSQ
jgi:hypothetical protein